MDLLALLVAENLTYTDGKWDIRGVFNRIEDSVFPTRPRTFDVYYSLRAGAVEYNTTRKVTVKLLDQDGLELIDWSDEITVPEGNNGQLVITNHALTINQVVFHNPGTYQVSILVDQDEKGWLTFLVETNGKKRGWKTAWYP